MHDSRQSIQVIVSGRLLVSTRRLCSPQQTALLTTSVRSNRFNGSTPPPAPPATFLSLAPLPRKSHFQSARDCCAQRPADLALCSIPSKGSGRVRALPDTYRLNSVIPGRQSPRSRLHRRGVRSTGRLCALACFGPTLTMQRAIIWATPASRAAFLTSGARPAIWRRLCVELTTNKPRAAGATKCPVEKQVPKASEADISQ